MQDIKLFICITPFTALFAQELIGYFRSSGDTDEAIIATRNYSFLRPEAWDKIYTLEEFNKDGDLDLSWYTKMIRDAKRLRTYVHAQLVCSGRKVTILFPTLDSLYTNAIYHSLRHHDNVSFAAIQDGTMNIFARRVDRDILKRQLVKMAVSTALGFSFRPFLGCLNGIDQEAVGVQYLSFAPQAFLEKTEIVALKAESQATLAQEPTVFLIGQEPIIETIGHEGYKKALRAIVGRSQTRFPSVTRYFYKFHPFCTKANREFVMDELSALLGSTNVDWLSDDRPVELLPLNTMGVVGCYSVNSSGSVNLALLRSASGIEMGIAGCELIYPDKAKREAMQRFYSACGLTVIDQDGREVTVE